MLAKDMKDDPCLLVQKLGFCHQGRDGWDLNENQVERPFQQKFQLDFCLRTSHLLKFLLELEFCVKVQQKQVEQCA